MTTRYRLPNELGGGIYDGEMNSTGAVACLEIPGVGTIEVPGACLALVKPPVPSEPEDGYVGRAGAIVWERDDRAEQQGDAGPGRRWWKPGDDLPYTWEAVHEINTNAGADLVRLVRDPGDDAPALPWKESNELTDDVHVANGVIWIEIQAGWHDADEARLRAAVILRAAREVEQP